MRASYLAVLGVECVAQPVAQKEEGEDGDDEEKQREGDLPVIAELHGARAFVDQRAERGRRLLHTQPQKADEAFEDDHVGHQQRGIDDHDAEQVGHDVPKDDPQRMHAGGHGHFDEFLVLDRQRLAPGDPRHIKP